MKLSRNMSWRHVNCVRVRDDLMALSGHELIPPIGDQVSTFFKHYLTICIFDFECGFKTLKKSILNRLFCFFCFTYLLLLLLFLFSQSLVPGGLSLLFVRPVT